MYSHAFFSGNLWEADLWDLTSGHNGWVVFAPGELYFFDDQERGRRCLDGPRLRRLCRRLFKIQWDRPGRKPGLELWDIREPTQSFRRPRK
jgi:hypothetical protein